VAVTVAVEHSASVVKGGVVLFRGLKALMQALAKAFLNALNRVLVLLTRTRPQINGSGEKNI